MSAGLGLEQPGASTRCLSNPATVAVGPSLALENDAQRDNQAASINHQALVTAVGQSDLSGFAIGSYQLGKRLGQGGMGAVYEATHLLLGKRFAIKFIRPEYSADKELRYRFASEYQSLGSLDHPNIVAIVDAGEIAGALFYVTEFLNGYDLHQAVSAFGPPSIEASCEIIRQTALGLGCAHQAGYVHRDIKPSNLFLHCSGTVKLLDFGLVRSTRNASTHTSAGGLYGSLDYISPEQAENPNAVAAPADIYSLGAVMVYLLSGEPPYPDAKYPNAVSKLRGHLSEIPEWLESNRQRLPSELAQLIESMLSKQPENRPQRCDEVIQVLSNCSSPKALQDWLSGEQADNPCLRRPSQALNENNRSRPSLLAVGSAVALGVVTIAALSRTPSASSVLSPSNPVRAEASETTQSDVSRVPSQPSSPASTSAAASDRSSTEAVSQEAKPTKNARPVTVSIPESKRSGKPPLGSPTRSFSP